MYTEKFYGTKTTTEIDLSRIPVRYFTFIFQLSHKNILQTNYITFNIKLDTKKISQFSMKCFDYANKLATLGETFTST